MAGMSFSAHISNKKSGITSKTKLEGVAKHNLRKYKSGDYSADHIVILQGTKNLVRDVKAVYHQEFDAALKDYNERQKRPERKIADYFDHVANKEQDMAVEIIIQLGDREYWKEHSLDRSFMKYIYEDMLTELKDLFPNFIVANAVVHLDEDSPHMHVVGVPVAYGYTRGLSKQVSKRWVFTPETLSTLLQGKLRAYANRMVDIWFREEIKEKAKGLNHDLTVMEYKVAMEEEKYAKLQQQVGIKESEMETLAERESEMVQKSAIAEEVYNIYHSSAYGDYDLREKAIKVMFDNQQLKEEVSQLRKTLDMAYEYMESIKIDGRSVLEGFLEWLNRTKEKVKGVLRR